MSKIKIFVYGTLLEGYGNHRHFLSNAEKLGEYQTDPKFTMISLGGFPGLMEGGKTSIQGEVYEVTEEEFKNVDRLEGYNAHNPTTGLYNRIQIPTEYGNAWVYIINRSSDRYPIITNGSWKDPILFHSNSLEDE